MCDNNTQGHAKENVRKSFQNFKQGGAGAWICRFHHRGRRALTAPLRQKKGNTHCLTASNNEAGSESQPPFILEKNYNIFFYFYSIQIRHHIRVSFEQEIFECWHVCSEPNPTV